MNTRAAPPPPPGLGKPLGVGQPHTSHLHSPQILGQPQQLMPLPPRDMASAAALLQHYGVELQQHLGQAPFALLPSGRPPVAGEGIVGSLSRDAAPAAEGAANAAVQSSLLKPAEIELKILLEIASAACVQDNKIDISLLSSKQRMAFVSLYPDGPTRLKAVGGAGAGQRRRRTKQKFAPDAYATKTV